MKLLSWPFHKIFLNLFERDVVGAIQHSLLGETGSFVYKIPILLRASFAWRLSARPSKDILHTKGRFVDQH